MDPVSSTRTPSCQTYKDNMYGQLLAQRELRRRRDDEQMARHKEARRLQQLEYARCMAELNRQGEVYQVAMRRKVEAIEHQTRMNNEESARRLNQMLRLPGLRHSTFGGKIQDLLDSFYEHPRPQPSSTFGRTPMPSAPQTFGVSPSPVAQTAKVQSTARDNATSGPASRTAPAAVSSVQYNAINVLNSQQGNASPPRNAVLNILSKFATLKSSFTFPSTLDFLPAPQGVSTSALKLAYTPNNAPLHQYEHLLAGLLAQLDAVEPYGDAEVRKARKDAVEEIEKELNELDGRKLDEWRRQFERGSMALEPKSEPMLDVNMTHHTSPTIEDSPRPQTSVDPALVSLLQGEDQKIHTGGVLEPPTTSSESGVFGSSSTKTSKPHEGRQYLVMSSELVEPIVPPVPSSSSARNTELVQDLSMNEILVDT
ncbi:hypothetical protein FRC07_006344 [Ceratobasidium sp. 392]|nr:hypothetical protein FRC07_006344 [Ceratobasidium sp. 392]